MKKGVTVLLASLLLLLFFLFSGYFSRSALAQLNGEFDTDRLIIKFKKEVGRDERNRLLEELKAPLLDRVEQLDVEVVGVERNKIRDLIQLFLRLSKVEYVEPDYKAQVLELTNDPGIVENKQWGMYKVKAADAGVSAWNSAKSTPDTKIAIIDTGIDQDHEDLSGKIVANKNCTDSPNVDDFYGHGTHVAGIAAAATNNGKGVAGLGYNATLMNAKGLGDNGSGYYSWIANCIIWSADNGAKVINMSLGGSFGSTTLQNAVNYAWNKGVVIAAAAGNSGNSSRTYPGYYSNVIAVAATDVNDLKASFSSYGKWVDVAAPGKDIYSTFPNHSNVIGKTNYDFASGTSMATPHVAGLAALVWATSYGTDKTSVRKQIEGTADKISGTGRYWTFGRINALKAVTELGVYGSASRFGF